VFRVVANRVGGDDLTVRVPGQELVPERSDLLMQVVIKAVVIAVGGDRADGGREDSFVVREGADGV
jgi:hypothetical protein